MDRQDPASFAVTFEHVPTDLVAYLAKIGLWRLSRVSHIRP